MKTEKKKDSPEAPEDGNIDKIRDILFGSQSRDFERRFSRMEERLSNDISEMRDDVRKRLESLEEYIKSEVKSLTERLGGEQNSRADAVKSLSDDLKDLSHNFDKKVTNLNDQSAKSESEFRQQMLAQSRSLSDEIQKKHSESQTSLNREAEKIRDEKTDRTALAELFTEMAMRLTGDFNLPDNE